jgi:hypothetical protein
MMAAATTTPVSTITRPTSILRRTKSSELNKNNAAPGARVVQFTGKVSIHKVDLLEPEDVDRLFYNKFEIRRFRNEEKEQQQEELAEFIHHLVGKIAKDMDLRFERVEELQTIEQQLLDKAEQEARNNGANDKNNGDIVVLYCSDDELNMIKLEDEQEEKRYQREERVLSKQVERQKARIKETMGSPVSVFETHTLILDTCILEDSFSDFTNFTPLDF